MSTMFIPPPPDGYKIHHVTNSGLVIPPASTKYMNRGLVLLDGHWIEMQHCPATVKIGPGTTFALLEAKP